MATYKKKFRRDPIVVIPYGRSDNSISSLLETLHGVYNSGILQEHPETDILVVGYCQPNSKLLAEATKMFGSSFRYVTVNDVIGSYQGIVDTSLIDVLANYRTYGNMRNSVLMALAKYYKIGINDNVPVLWLDDDTIPLPDWYSPHLQYLGNRKKTGLVLLTTGNYTERGSALDAYVVADLSKKGNFDRLLNGKLPIVRTPKQPHPIEGALGGNMAMLGIPPVPFPSSYAPMRDEDGILASELISMGHSVYYVPSVVKHMKRPYNSLHDIAKSVYAAELSRAYEMSVFRGLNSSDAVDAVRDNVVRMVSSLSKKLKYANGTAMKSLEYGIGVLNTVIGMLDSSGVSDVEDTMRMTSNINEQWDRVVS